MAYAIVVYHPNNHSWDDKYFNLVIHGEYYY